MDYTAFLQSLSLSVEKEEDRYFVRIRSAQPVNEPYIGVLLELSANGERKGREYAITLDPGEWTNLRAAPLSTAASMQRLSRQQRIGRQSAAASSTAARPATVIGSQESHSLKEAGATEYVVSRGDSLSKIAGRLGNRSVSLEQMLVVLYRNNPTAFLDNNMNLLREGAVLSIPKADAANPVSQRDARRMVRLHATHFRRYSQKLAAMVQKSAPGITPTGTDMEGKVFASVREQPGSISKRPDRLELSKANPEAQQGGMTPEEKLAMNKAIEDANARITELEKNVDELRKLLAIVSKNGVTPVASVASPEKTEKPEEAKSREAEGQANVTDKEKAGLEKEGINADQTLAGAAAETKASEKKKDKDDEDEGDKDGEKKKSDFLHNLKNNTVWHVAIGAIMALLALLGLVSRSRSKKPPAPVSRPVVVPPPPKEVREVNPNIISGRDYLENLPPEEIEDDSDDEAPLSSIAITDRDDDEILEGIIDTPAEMIELKEMPQAQEAQAEQGEEPEESERDSEPETEEIFVEEMPEVLETPVEPEVKEETASAGDDDVMEEETEAGADTMPLDLNLSDITPEPEVADEVTSDMASSTKPETGGVHNAEMAAKLELALAYMDMKDKEGARELLEEVIARGTPQQAEEATQMMQYL
jgi:FimV-like protein